MRTFFAGCLALFLASACGPSAAPITVVHVGRTVATQEGSADRVSMHRPPPEPYTGVRTGAYVVRDEDDWAKIWKDGAQRADFPKSVTPGREMLVVVANDDPNVSHIKVRRAVETGSLMTVFVRQTLLGEGCLRKPDERVGTDTVVMARTDKPVKFFIEDEDDASCGGLPKADLGCHVPSAKTPTTKLSATAGEVAECDLTASTSGKYALVEQLLTLVDAPPGSNAKLAFARGPNHASFTLDAFGTYVVRAEATDDLGRKGSAIARIEVVPKKTRDVLLQVTWSDVTQADGSEPRVVLRVAQEGKRGQRCSAEVPVPGLCEAKTRGSYTSMKIPASKRSLALSLLYLDERPKNGPSPCVNVWFDGERTFERCDGDARRPEDRWEIGTIDTATGTIATPSAPPAPAPAPPPAGSAAPAASAAPPTP
jgi:hypothetical protein